MSILMIVPFMILVMISLIFYNLFNYDIGEGMTFSTVIMIMTLVLSNTLTGNFYMGYSVILGLTLFGMISSVYKTKFIQNFIHKKSKHGIEGRSLKLEEIINPYIFFLLVIGVVLCCLYHNDFIQNIDEFHQWAAVPKYMLEHNGLPEHIEYIRRDSSFATSIFIYFFQSFTGYNEGLMYVAGNLLYWIGFLLPFGNMKKENWKQIGIYVLIIYLSLYTLYIYGAKNLYVDISVAAWSAGLFGWISCQKKFKISKLPILIGSLFLIYNMKTSLGRSMVIIIAAFYVIQLIYLKLSATKKRYFNYGLTIFIILSFVFISLFTNFIYNHDINAMVPDNIGVFVRSSGFSQQKLLDLSTVFIKRILGSQLGAASSPFKISFFAVLILTCIILFVVGDVCGRLTEYACYIIFIIESSVVYLFILWLGFLFIFGYELGSKATSFSRYGSIFAIAILAFAIFKLIENVNVKKSNLTRGLVIVLLFVFAYGIDGKYIINSTVFDKENVVGYEQIENTKEQVRLIKNIINDTDKVYLINQSFGSMEDQFVTDVALYYLDEQVSDNQREPYMFTTFGSYIGLNECASPTIYDLKTILTEKRYRYVWINHSNDFLKKYLPDVMGDEKLKNYGDEDNMGNNYESRYISTENIHDNQLYQVIYVGGVASKLKLVNNIINYDIRQE